ncbi:hypothetical protein U2I54_27020 [Bacillus pseudomycoides]|uniref:Uncharacterized protein n=1 Tax=Bacillus bingmayongensis TaxID=1150157 RepID=A0ABU5K4A7_9BACI|nr:hypothetical protein [Bacillus pseudomycoides]
MHILFYSSEKKYIIGRRKYKNLEKLRGINKKFYQPVEFFGVNNFNRMYTSKGSVAASKYPSSAPGTRWTAQIRIDGIGQKTTL